MVLTIYNKFSIILPAKDNIFSNRGVKKMKQHLIAVVVVTALLWGCAAAPVQNYFSLPEMQTATKDRINITMAPFKEDASFFTGFDLTIENRSNRPVELDWNQCRYLHKGTDQGLLVFPGIVPETVRTGIPPQTIFAGDTFAQKVYPFRTIAFLPKTEILKKGRSGFMGGALPSGENSLLIVLQQGEKQIEQVLTVRLRTSSAPANQ